MEKFTINCTGRLMLTISIKESKGINKINYYENNILKQIELKE